MWRRQLICIAAALIAAGPVIGRQTGVKAIGVVAGRVIDASTGAPLVGATVELSSAIEVESVQGVVGLTPLTREEAERRGLTPPQQQKSGPGGEFAFDGVRPGQLHLVARHPAYLAASPGRQRHDGLSRPVTVGPGQAVRGITILAWKRPIVSGSVRDEVGDAVASVEVVALRQVYQGGRARLEAAGRTQTDDRGQYRFVNLSPGQYVMGVPSTTVTFPGGRSDQSVPSNVEQLSIRQTAAVRSGAPVMTGDEVLFRDRIVSWRGLNGSVTGEASALVLAVYSTTLYPGTDSMQQAARVELEGGRELAGINFELTRQKTHSVSGKISQVDGRLGAVGLRLVRVDAHEALVSSEGFEVGWTVTDERGEFSFLGIPNGAYRLIAAAGDGAWLPMPDSPAFRLLDTTITPSGSVLTSARTAGRDLLWADIPVVVDADDADNLQVILQPAPTVSGRFEFRGKAALPDETRMANMAVGLRPLDLPRKPVAPGFARAGKFLTAPYPPGRYELEVRHPTTNWRVESVLIGGVEHYDRCIDLTTSLADVVVILTDRTATLSGSVALSTDAARGGATVVVFPADVEGWISKGMLSRMTRTTAVAQDGSFAVRNLHPGRYDVVAVPPHVAVELQNPDFVRGLAPIGTEADVRPGSAAVMPPIKIANRR